jgi:hypothetical protein
MENIVEPTTNKPFESDKDREIAERYKHIPGWGIDADPDNNPTYPMKNYTGADHERLDYEKPPQQPVNIEVLHSNERPSVSRVFGTSSPPSGLSGRIRRFAFQYSESTYKHWVPLVVADRVGVVEGIIEDLKNGIVPNIFAEKGWKAEWKYNRTGLMKKVAVVAFVATALIMMSRKGKRLQEG